MTENHTAYWPDYEDPLAQEHGFVKFKRAEMRLFAAVVLAVELQGKPDEAAFIDQSMAEAASRSIYGNGDWERAKAYVRSQVTEIAATARNRMEAVKR